MLMSLEAGLPQWLRGKESTCNVQDAGDMGLIPGWEHPLQEVMATHSSILARKIPWIESLAVHGVAELNTGLKCRSTHAHTSLKAMQGETLLAYVLSEVS